MRIRPSFFDRNPGIQLSGRSHDSGNVYSGFWVQSGTGKQNLIKGASAAPASNARRPGEICGGGSNAKKSAVWYR